MEVTSAGGKTIKEIKKCILVCFNCHMEYTIPMDQLKSIHVRGVSEFGLH